MGWEVRRVRSLDLERLSCLSQWRYQVDSWIHEGRTKHLEDAFTLVVVQSPSHV